MHNERDNSQVDNTSSSREWMYDTNEEYIDLHAKLHPYIEVIKFLAHIEEEFAIKEYSNGKNSGGRWFFQIYSREFIQQLTGLMGRVLKNSDKHGPVLEVMAGDGKLTQFLQPFITREIIATDAKTERYNIAFPKWVKKMDAEEAVLEFDPPLVLMSWEPYLSTKGLEIVEMGLPMIWIGNPKRCGHFDLFEKNHTRVKSDFCTSRHDSVVQDEFPTDIYLFNCNFDSL